MASGDLLRQLFKGYAKRDDAVFRSAAEALIHDERLKNHKLLADELERILYNGNGSHGERRHPYERDIPRDRERGFPLLEIGEHRYDWEQIILPAKSLQVLKRLANEHHRKDILASAGLKPTQKVLFYGPPGCGKTLAGKILSSVLHYPLVTVRFDAVVSSYLGETAANLRRVFDFISRGTWIVLFDEFDAIGKDRDNPFEHGELKRVVNSLLQLIDAFYGESLLIAATNHEKLLDTAVWRRFESIIHFPVPTEQDRVLLLGLYLGGFDSSNLDLKTIARKISGATGSDIQQLAIEAARLAVLDNRTLITEQDIEPSLRTMRERFKLLRETQTRDSKPLDQ